MRVLRLDLGRNRVELHPFVTVVRGLTPELRARLLEVLAGIPAGETPVGGLIEAHGVLLDLAPATLGLLDLDAPLDVVVRAHDLPSANGRAPAGGAAPAVVAASAPAAEAALADARAAAQAAEARARAARAALAALDADAPPAPDDDAAGPASTRAAARREAEQALLAAEDHRRATATALAEAEAEAERARAARADASRAVSVAAALLETSSERRDATAAAVVDAARARVAEAEATLERIRGGEGQAEAADEPEVEVEALQAERQAHQAALLALDTTDPLPVQVALDQLRAGGAPELLPSPEAIALADELAAVEAQLARTPGVGADQAGVQHEERALARRRVELAEQALAELEASSRRPVYEPADVAALEKAHLDVIEAREAAGKRFGAARAARRLEEVELIEQQVLDRMGLVTYTEYLMGAGGSSAAMQVETSMPARLDALRDELARAEAQLESREIDVIDELERAELIDRRRALRAQAVELLGTEPDDLEGALRRHRVEATATGEHLVRLRGALDGAGLALADEDVDEQLLIDLARVWLREQSETESQRRALEQEIAAIDVRLAAAEARGAAPALDEPLAVAAGAVEDARRALEAAEARLARDAAVADEVEALREAFAAASAADGDAAAAVTAAEAAVQQAAEAADAAALAARSAEARLVAAEQAEREAVAAAAAHEEQLAAARAGGRQALADEVAAAERAVAAAVDAVTAAEAALDEARRADAQAAVAPAHSPAATADAAPADQRSVDDVEWYLLARLAAQRSVSYAGSVPLVLDDALGGFEPDEARAVLDRLERMAATVQLVVVTEDLATAAWAESLGEARAQVTEVGAGS